MQEERQGRYRKPRIEFFLANYIAGKIAGEVNLTKLFSEYKAFIQYQPFPSVAAELKELNRFGVHLHRACRPKRGPEAHLLNSVVI